MDRFIKIEVQKNMSKYYSKHTGRSTEVLKRERNSKKYLGELGTYP
jgi:hypothetical protein